MGPGYVRLRSLRNPADWCAMTDKQDSRAFYDDYVERQAAVGINERHRSIGATVKCCG